jgi:hypothetical protein
MKTFQLDTSPYNQDVWVILGDSASNAVKFINEKFKDNIDELDDDGNRCRGFQWKTHYLSGSFEKARFFIYIHIKDLKKSTTVEHELLHLTWDILHHVGVRLTPNNHEAQTYLFEHLINDFKNKSHGRINNRRTKKPKENRKR